MKIRRRSIMASTDKDYASLRGIDFKKARDILTKDGFHEHEYGDKDDNNGYAVYRKGDKEVELQYRWNQGKRKGEAHAGKVTNVYVDDDINSACGKKSIKSAVSNEQYVANSNGEDNIAKGRTLDECIKNLLRKVDAEDIIDWAIYIDKYVDGEWVESFKETDVYDMVSDISAACGKKSVKAEYQLQFPYMVEGEFADGYTYTAGGNSEAECVETLANMQDKHGELVWYSGVTDEDYDAGRRIDSACRRRSVKASAVMGAMDTENLTIYVPSYCYVDVMVDSYEQGEGEQVNSWTFQVADGFRTAQELIDDIAESSGIFSNDINDYVVLDSSLQTDATVNAENGIPTEEELEAWKRGELELYTAHLWVRLQVGSKTHDMTEDEAEAFGLSVY